MKLPYREGIRKSLGIEEEAVSPVIATVLMVAITVVIAATVYILVSHYVISGQTQFIGTFAVVSEQQVQYSGSGGGVPGSPAFSPAITLYVYNITLTYSSPSLIKDLSSFHLVLGGYAPGFLNFPTGPSFHNAEHYAAPYYGTPPHFVAYVINPDGTTLYFKGPDLLGYTASSLESGATFVIISEFPLSGQVLQASISGDAGTPSLMVP